AAGPDLDAVFARDERWLGDVLVEAQICIARSDPAGALRRVLAALAHGGDARLLGWLRDWTRAGRLAGRFDGQPLARALLNVERSAHASPELAGLLDDCLDELDDQIDWRDASITVRVRLKRMRGRPADALALAERLEAAAPGLYSAAAVAACHRDAGDYPASIAASQRAAAHAPDDGHPLLDAGDLALDQLDDYAQAISAYAEAERRGARPDWARLSRLAAEYLQRPGAATRAAFEAEAQISTATERLEALRERLDDWIGCISPPREALIGMLRQFGDGAGGGEVRIELSAPEAACAHWTVQACLAQTGTALSLSVGTVRPDPREGLDRMAAFRWVDAGVEPVHPRPEAAPWSEVQTLADSDYTPADWLHRARALRAALAVDSQTLVAMIPHPPEPPREDDDPLWWQRAWTAACSFLIGAGQGGWSDLVDLVRAPIDWPGEAALMALAAQVAEHPERHADYLALLDACRARYPEHGDCCLRYGVDAGLRYLAEQLESAPDASDSGGARALQR
ncbi:MAG: hypothetical protein MUE46_15015, partial [Xanthomonadales bacterium]|nr:hypothetical protein [Xanthomonadales bacterium]